MIIQFLPQLIQKKFVLASASPRRRELLTNIGVKFEVIPSSFDELLPHKDYPRAADYATATALQKALEVAKTHGSGTPSHPSRPVDIVIGADTVVEHGGLILEKPADAADALSMLRRLSGGQHHVHTGVAVVLPQAIDPVTGVPPYVRTFSCTTAVQFDTLSDEAIHAYIATGEPFGKAGSYGIQGPAGAFVKGIDGCYFNVMGFPLHEFTSQLASLIAGGQLPLKVEDVVE
ncbi:MAG: hypothetical protein WDW38_008786 [Sanguina aurantia]